MYRLLCRDEPPSFGAFLRLGLNTWPELWSVSDRYGGSRIHTCYTGVSGFLMQGLAGIRLQPGCPGEVLLAPLFPPALSSLDCAQDLGHGPLCLSRARGEDGVHLRLNVPFNTRVLLRLPGRRGRRCSAEATRSGARAPDAFCALLVRAFRCTIFVWRAASRPRPRLPRRREPPRPSPAAGRARWKEEFWMETIRFAMLGGGWRSEFYTRIANAAPEQFRLCGVWIRNPQKAERYRQKYGVPVFASFEELLPLDVDFYVVCLPWKENMEFSRRLIEAGRAVLTETPPAPTTQSLNEFWRFCRERRARIQIGEEYHFQPYHAAVLRLVREGLIGTPTHLSLSMMHGYHAMSIGRQLLGLGLERAAVSGKRYLRQVAHTCDRSGESADHPLRETSQDRVTLEFENGKTLFYDFSGEQYFSLLRSPSLWLCAERGEVRDSAVRFLNDSGECAAAELSRVDLGRYGNLQGFSHRGIQFCGRWVYENPLPLVPLTDDELAVAANLLETKRYLATGEQSYTLRDACQDTYLSFAMQEAIATGRTVETEPQSWSE